MLVLALIAKTSPYFRTFIVILMFTSKQVQNSIPPAVEACLGMDEGKHKIRESIIRRLNMALRAWFSVLQRLRSVCKDARMAALSGPL